MQWYKKIPYLIIFLTLLGCSTMKIDDFANTEPEFNLMQFFEGNVEAWGIVEDRFGNLKRQFKVDMNGTIKDGVLTLEEDFIYALGNEIRDTSKSFSLNNKKQHQNLIDALKITCRKYSKEKTGKKPFTNINIIQI